MDLLKLPELFKGEWENLLILTYGVEIPFFENSLWRQLPNRCRNKVILADANCYLRSCKQYANDGSVRFLNQKYLVDGIFIPQSAHAKLILLTNREKGRLVIGSGNLGMDGYASGGELFTHYEYSEKSPESLTAFLSTWEFIQELIARGYIGPSAIPYLRHLHTRTPWFFKSAKSDLNQVRHNLTTNFLDQIKESIQGEEVEELWILSPFYDEKAYALKKMLQELSPKRVVILVQDGRTSLDPNELKKVLNEFSIKSTVRTFQLKEDDSNAYVHAKMYLLKTQKHAVCLQGSPNLSQVAMLLTPPSGNIELANLSKGNKNDFDHLLENLEIDPDTTDLQTLNLSFDKPDKEDDISKNGWRLTGGTWQENKLVLYFQGEKPDSEDFKVMVGDDIFSVGVVYVGEKSLELRLPVEAKDLLSSPIPVSVVFKDEELPSNPIFVCNAVTLKREMLETVVDEAEIERIGDLDLEDETLERLLGELEAALVIDRRSIWLMAGRTPPKVEDDDEVLNLKYSEIDYEQIKRHPKILHYLGGVHGDGQLYGSKSRLQIILSAITDHFNGLVKIKTGKGIDPSITGEVEPGIEEAETEEESEQEDKEKQKRQRSLRARIRGILKSFINRYIRGIESPDFQELAGFEVMSRNYVIFSHLLWKLLTKDWVEPEFIFKSFVQVWRLFWGVSKLKGYYSQLNEKEQEQVLKLIQEHHNGGLLVAAVYYGEYLSSLEGWEEIRFSLRNFLRDFVSNKQLEIDRKVIEDAWIFVSSLLPYDPPIPSKIIDGINHLANYENQKSFLQSIEQNYGYKKKSCSIEKQEVYREHLYSGGVVDCLVIKDPNAISQIDIAYSIVNDWERYNLKDYYRINSGERSRIFYFDARAKKGCFFNKDTGEDIPFSEIPKKEGKKWETILGEIQEKALKVDDEISFMTQVDIEDISKKIDSIA
jgi:hypothetical protein